MKRAKTAAFDELYAGYQAIADVTLDQPGLSAVSYEVGYLDGWADAMNHAGWAADGKPLKRKDSFSLHAVRSIRNSAAKKLKLERERRTEARNAEREP
jgi:hypothetical protein